MSKNKELVTGQRKAKKETVQNRKSSFGNDVNYSGGNNSMFIVDWQVRDKKTTTIL